MPAELKLYYDQIDYSVGLHEIYRGLLRFTQVCQIVGIIKPLPYNSEKLIYENRFRAFEVLQIPRYVPYASWKAQMDKEFSQEDFFEKYLDEAKLQFTAAG